MYGEQLFRVSYKNIDSECGRLFVFPYAGGGASVFRNWQKEFKDINVFAAQYPGREDRIAEDPIKNFHELLQEIFLSIIDFIPENNNYYFFGHSLGTKIIYELALKLKKEKNTVPRRIIVAGGRAPCFKEMNPIYNLNDEEFIKELKRFSGTPEKILANNELMNIFLPMLRADFEIDEKYENKVIEKLDCSILGLMGTEDSELTLDELMKWSEYTNKDFNCKKIEGGHMFINTNYIQVINCIKEFM
ncbi:thioesterase II family protein [Clostridium sporogenes]|uniref:thioesterase II family protein n=1 Tax=Clostridium sporogenes TaxID=1509 RepID=UPI0005EFF008|nr:thioesterase domain-containing protein [Clostridium sporogenes]